MLHRRVGTKDGTLISLHVPSLLSISLHVPALLSISLHVMYSSSFPIHVRFMPSSFSMNFPCMSHAFPLRFPLISSSFLHNIVLQPVICSLRAVESSLLTAAHAMLLCWECICGGLSHGLCEP